MNAYQLKAAIKNQKPLVWRRCIVPGGITYSQLSLILTDVMDRQEEADFEFEFYQKKIRFGESREDKPMKPDFLIVWRRPRSSILMNCWTQKTGSVFIMGISLSCGLRLKTAGKGWE